MKFWLTIALFVIVVLTILVGIVAGCCLDRFRPLHAKRRKQRYVWPCYLCAIFVVFLGVWSSFSRIEVRIALGTYHGTSALMVKGMVNLGWFRNHDPGLTNSSIDTFPVTHLDSVSAQQSFFDHLATSLATQQFSMFEYLGYIDSPAFYHYLDMPIWLLLIPIVLYPALTGLWGLFRFVQSKRNARIGSCCVCGYDLTGNVSGVCPECGKETRVAESSDRCMDS